MENPQAVTEAHTASNGDKWVIQKDRAGQRCWNSKAGNRKVIDWFFKGNELHDAPKRWLSGWRVAGGRSITRTVRADRELTCVNITELETGSHIA